MYYGKFSIYYSIMARFLKYDTGISGDLLGFRLHSSRAINCGRSAVVLIPGEASHT